jgi:transcriptional regulator with PAS, ATPase and Fis domain
VKLLRVLQEQEIERVGGKNPIPVDVRILCSTAKDLAVEVEKGVFRKDLFYRLQVIPISVPPLRERNGDIAELTNYFLKKFGNERGLTFKLSPEAFHALQNYHFPGNIRELRNILERMTVLAPSPLIQLWDLPVEIHGCGKESTPEEATTLAVAVVHAEKKCILNALKKTGGNKTEAAEILGISRKNLWEKMKQYRL